MNTTHIIIAFIIATFSIFCIEKEINPLTYLEEFSKSTYELIIKSEQKLVASEKSLEGRLEGGNQGIN